MTLATPSLRSTCLLAFTRVGGIPVALDAAHIVAIVSAADVKPQSEATALVDVAVVLGAAAAVGPVSVRRAARTRDGTAIVVGEALDLAEISFDDMYALPATLAGLQAKAGVIGFVRHRERLHLLVDITALPKLAPRAPDAGAREATAADGVVGDVGADHDRSASEARA